VVLRPLTEADGGAFARHVSSDLERLARHLPWLQGTRTPEGAAAWLGRYERQENGRVLAAGAWRDDELLGGAALLSHDPVALSVELGVWVVAPAAGTGLAAACCRELLAVARGRLGAERVAWQCDAQNAASRRLAERLGFRFEGTLRSATVLRGERRDLDLLSLVGDEIDAAVA
jgi:RimJ/RimL family protein N-acetyltransferase